jgi:hypothetical protein
LTGWALLKIVYLLMRWRCSSSMTPAVCILAASPPTQLASAPCINPEYRIRYNTARPHQGIAQHAPDHEPDAAGSPDG